MNELRPRIAYLSLLTVGLPDTVGAGLHHGYLVGIGSTSGDAMRDAIHWARYLEVPGFMGPKPIHPPISAHSYCLAHGRDDHDLETCRWLVYVKMYFDPPLPPNWMPGSEEEVADDGGQPARVLATPIASTGRVQLAPEGDPPGPMTFTPGARTLRSAIEARPDLAAAAAGPIGDIDLLVHVMTEGASPAAILAGAASFLHQTTLGINLPQAPAAADRLIAAALTSPDIGMGSTALALFLDRWPTAALRVGTMNRWDVHLFHAGAKAAIDQRYYHVVMASAIKLVREIEIGDTSRMTLATKAAIADIFSGLLDGLGDVYAEAEADPSSEE